MKSPPSKNDKTDWANVSLKRKVWGFFVIIILPFSVHTITILPSCIYHEKEDHMNTSETLFSSYVVQ